MGILRMMKIAFCGKGGVGKSSIAVLLSLAFLEDGYQVLAIDADPSPHLVRLFGIEKEVIPIAEMEDLLAERAQKSGSFYTLNPKIEDLPEKFLIQKGNLKLMVLGAIREAGRGCACPEQTVLRKLLTYLILKAKEVVIVDMEAGVEHFGRASIVPMDAILTITKPYKGSIETTKHILNLAEQLRMKNVWVIGNAVKSEKEAEIIKKEFSQKLLGILPQDEELERREIEGENLWNYKGLVYQEVRKLKNKLVERFRA